MSPSSRKMILLEFHPEYCSQTSQSSTEQQKSPKAQEQALKMSSLLEKEKEQNQDQLSMKLTIAQPSSKISSKKAYSLSLSLISNFHKIRKKAKPQLQRFYARKSQTILSKESSCLALLLCSYGLFSCFLILLPSLFAKFAGSFREASVSQLPPVPVLLAWQFLVLSQIS